MNNYEIGEKIEVYNLLELTDLPKDIKFFACIGGSKNYECFVENKTLSRKMFMEKYKDKLDKCHTPIYEDDDIIIRQDAQIAIPGFYIVATKKNYKNIIQMDIEIYQKCLYYVFLIRKELSDNFNIKQAYMYYDEHYYKPSSTHFWIMPIYADVIKSNNLNPTILSKDIWEYQDIFEFSQTKNDIYRINHEMKKILNKNK